MSTPALLIPGASVCDRETIARRDEAYLAMQAAVEIGQYLLAEHIRRDHLLIACALCATCEPPKQPLRYGYSWTVFKQPWSFLLCWQCVHRTLSTTHWPTGGPGESHACHRILKHCNLNLPERWLCELVQ